MNQSDVKKQIDGYIQSERWMTPQLATKMAVPKRKKQRSIKPLIIIVCAALLCVVFVASFKESSTSLTAPPTEAIEQIMDNPLLTSMFNDYLTAIEEQDEVTLATLSFDYFKGENLKKLYALYENINFDSIEILNIVPSKGEPAYSIFITAKNEATNEILVHSIEMVQSNEDFYISENIERAWSVYMPYEPPITLALTYGTAPIGHEEDSWATRDVELAQPSIDMPNVGLVHFYKQGNGLVLVVVEREQRYIQLGYLDDIGQIFTISQFALEPIYVIESSSMQRRLLIYLHENQIYWFESDPNESLTVSDMNHDDEIELLFNDTILRIYNHELQYAFIHDAIEEQWQQAFITTEFKENTVHLQYEDLNGKVVAQYAFDEEMKLQLQTVTSEKPIDSTMAVIKRVSPKETDLLVEWQSDAMDRGIHDYNTDAHGKLVVEPFNGTLQRGDVIYYQMPEIALKANENLPEMYLGRVVGLPGETVEIKKGQVYIDNQTLATFYGMATSLGLTKEQYFDTVNPNNINKAQMVDYFNTSMESIQVQENTVFVLVDTWWRGTDSKDFGLLPMKNIQGKVLGYKE